MTLTQSEVDDHFAMSVPVFIDFGKGMGRLGQMVIEGHTSRSVDVLLPSQPKKGRCQRLQRNYRALTH